MGQTIPKFALINSLRQPGSEASAEINFILRRNVGGKPKFYYGVNNSDILILKGGRQPWQKKRKLISAPEKLEKSSG